MSKFLTGKEAYALASDLLLGFMLPVLFPDYEAHKDDDDGHWYIPCSPTANWPDPNDEVGHQQFSVGYYASHPPVYMEARDAEPQLALSPDQPRAIAVANLVLRPPTLDWNPKLTGRGTLVNLDTSFWVVDPSAP